MEIGCGVSYPIPPLPAGLLDHHLLANLTNGNDHPHYWQYLGNVVSPPQITADQNNYNPAGLDTASVARLTTDATWNITGLVATGSLASLDGRLMLICNVNPVGGFNIVMVSESGASLAANRMSLGANIVLVPGDAITLVYNVATNRWMRASTSLISAPMPALHAFTHIFGGIDAVAYSLVNATDYPLTVTGDLLYKGAGGPPERLPRGTAVQVIHGGVVPTYGPVVEDDLSLSNVVTANATIARHGLLPVLPNDPAKYLNGQGNFTNVVSGAASGYIEQAFGPGVMNVNVVHNFNGYPNVQLLDNAVTPNVFVPLSIVHNSKNDFTVNFAVASTGTVIATLGSPGTPNVVFTAINYAALASDKYIIATAAITVTLPTAAGIAGREYIVKRDTAAGDVTVNCTGAETIDGEATLILGGNHSAARLVSNGTNWIIA